MLFDIKKIIFNMYNCCCKRLNENRDKLYWLSIFSTWCNLLNDKVKPMYLFSADFHAAARAELFIFFSLPSGSTCASSGKILVAEPPTRKKGSFSVSRAGGSAARIFLEAISGSPSPFLAKSR